MNIGDTINRYSYVKFKIQEKNIENILIKLYRNNINIYDITKVSSDTYILSVHINDYAKTCKLCKNIFIRNMGFKRIIDLLKVYKYILVGILISIGVIYIASNFIFRLDIVSNDKDLINRLTNSLNKYGVGVGHMRKKYDVLARVKEHILEDYKEEIEWLEINRIGTKYIVKLNPRVLKNEEIKYKKQNIIAKKNANILYMDIKSGEIVKDKYSYVSKGEVIVSGYNYLNDKIKAVGSAIGKVYGETWYITKVKYPFNYYEYKETGKKNKYLSIKFINNSIDIFKFKSFDDKISKDSIILHNNILPIKLLYKEDKEIKVISSMNTIEELKMYGIKYAVDKMNKKLHDKEYIINYKVLDSKIISSGVELTIFFSICEDITEYQEIEEVNIDEKRSNESN